MTAREFADTIAVPNIYEFMDDPSQRRGYSACLSAYHVGDYLMPAGERQRDAVHAAMEGKLDAPFLALQRMATAVKHREKTGKGGVVLMESGSDTVRPPAGFDECTSDNPFRLHDGGGGRWIEDAGRCFDMLDLCVIVLRAYAKLYPSELAGSAIDDLCYNPAEYPR